MYTYVKRSVKGKYVEFPEELNPELYDNLGITYQDYLDGKGVLLSEEQLAFKRENYKASIKEVINMKFDDPPVVTLDQAKMGLKTKIIAYDSSHLVNGFYINGIEVWLDKATRAGLKLRFEAEIAAGQTDTILGYDNMQFPLILENAVQMLYAIEIYASACYDNTQRHLAAITKLDTVAEVNNYDYTTGYPEKLNF